MSPFILIAIFMFAQFYGFFDFAYVATCNINRWRLKRKGERHIGTSEAATTSASQRNDKRPFRHHKKVNSMRLSSTGVRKKHCLSRRENFFQPDPKASPFLPLFATSPLHFFFLFRSLSLSLLSEAWRAAADNEIVRTLLVKGEKVENGCTFM